MFKWLNKKDCIDQHIEYNFLGIKFKYRPKNKSIFYVGKNNTLKIIRKDGSILTNPMYIKGLTISFSGNNSLVELEEPFNFNNCKIHIGTNNIIKIRKTMHLISNADFLIFRQHHNRIQIGENFSSESIVFDLGDEPNTSITIGNDCMASHSIILRPSDSHTIKDSEGRIINKAKDILIGNHVWLGFQTFYLKGAIVPDGSVVAARSTYTRNSYTKEKIQHGGVIFAGSPAKIIKQDISWERTKPCDAV